MKHLYKDILLSVAAQVMFTCCQPDISHGDIDLDTTYFPFGLGYEWCYESKYTTHSDDPLVSQSYSSVFTIKVTDSTWQGDSLFFELNDCEEQYGELYRDLPNPVMIWQDSILLSWSFFGYSPWIFPISFINLDTTSGYYGITQVGDSLVIREGFEIGPFSSIMPLVYQEKMTTRLKGIGVTNQYFLDKYSTGNGFNSSTVSDRLLWFYNGKDTVYKAPD